MTYKEIRKNKEIKAFIKRAGINLTSLGFTDHSEVHTTLVADRAAAILKEFGYDEHTIELAKIAGYMHDIGNAVNRTHHAEYGAILANDILKDTDMPLEDRVTIVSCIGSHDESTGGATDPVSAAVIIGDKTDVRRNRVSNKDKSSFDIHDRVNYAVTEASLKINADKKVISLNLQIDESICTMYDYFDIFLQRMLMCRGAAGVLGAKMLESGDAKIDPSKKVLGFVGSMDTANINDFLVGYLEGVKYVDPEIKVMTSYVGSFEDVSKCMEMTTQPYNQGAQVVYAPASQSILGAATAAQNADKYLIACDQDLYSELAESDKDLAANILSSSLKNVGESIFTAVEGWQKGEMSLDQDYTLGLDSGAVGLAKNENYKAIVPEDIQKFIDETEQKVIDGEITVGTAFDMSTDEVAALRDSMKP